MIDIRIINIWVILKDGNRLLGRYIFAKRMWNRTKEDEPMKRRTIMKMKYFNGKELDDAKIIETLSKVVSMYDNGENSRS